MTWASFAVANALVLLGALGLSFLLQVDHKFDRVLVSFIWPLRRYKSRSYLRVSSRALRPVP
ncbi:MAG: hypothetical protein H0W90_16190 [Actinobacteria bacterium]|nr:hypothetical protein [Actinomycetota bacterium]